MSTRPRPAAPRWRARLRQPRTIGALGLAIAVLVGAGITVLSTATFGARVYHAALEQTAGLRVGESVQVAGVEVGEVRSIELRDRHVDVTFTVADDVRLGSRTSASVRVATLLGTHFLQVEPAGGGELADDAIPLERTSVPFNLQDVLDATTDQLGRLDTEALSDALGSVTDVLRASGGEVGPALDGVTRLSDVVVRRGADFEQLLRSTRAVTDQLNAGSGDLVRLMRYASSFLQELVDRRDDVHDLLLHVTDLSETVSSIADDTEGDLGPLLADLDTVTDALNEQERALAVAARRLAVSSRYLANATGSGPWANLYVPDSQPDLVACLDGDC